MAKGKKNEWLDLLKTVLIAVLIAAIVRMFLFAPIVVDGPSMQPNLHDRDHMIVNKFSYYLHEPDRFDIVVFHESRKKDFIKRVIGLPGEKVQYKDDTLYIDGKKVEEPFLQGEKAEKDTNGPLTGDFKLEELPGEYEKVPEDHVLVLGDNRKNSTDSRIIGTIPIESIVGKANFTYWPLNRIKWLHTKE